jgi:hypothetical protein
MYKDKDKQREAAKEAMRRKRAKAKGITPDVIPKPVIPSQDVIPVIPCVIPKRQRHYILDPLPGQPKPRTSPIKQLVTPANVQSVAQAIAKPQQQRISHHPQCNCYQCKPPKIKDAHTEGKA